MLLISYYYLGYMWNDVYILDLMHLEINCKQIKATECESVLVNGKGAVKGTWLVQLACFLDLWEYSNKMLIILRMIICWAWGKKKHYFYDLQTSV